MFTWCSFFGWQDSLFPDKFSAINYGAMSPTIGKRIWFKGEKSIYDEIDRILDENTEKGGAFSAGQSLYYQVPFFCNAKLFAKNQYANILEEYQLIQDYHIPIARSIDEAPVLKLGMFNIIRQELLACQNRQMDMNKNG